MITITEKHWLSTTAYSLFLPNVLISVTVENLIFICSNGEILEMLFLFLLV